MNIHVYRGRVLRYNADRGYGFIEFKGHDDMFVHASKILDRDKKLQPDDEVEFAIGVSGKSGRSEAVNVKRV